ncbi:uncharacterized protein LOC111035312 isoform X1 [Myzus persicae]|uniref:uncharacterized protein LOC111035312 isoform X1 n=1 Tax=Myzus persicae TaxID=13164 RepID=UPI000B93333A|nr:uncharacterized protein LOC111035312 isoform X1 [Myzus persicae]
MDYNSIDEDDVDNLRLAALMTLKNKSYLPINTGSSKSAKCLPHNMFAYSSEGSSYNNPVRNNGGWFPLSNKPSSKHSLRHVNLKKSVYPNRNLIAIVPSDIECDFNSDLTNSTLVLDSDDKKSPNTHDSSNEVSTKFSRLEHESDSEESEDSEPEINEREESDDCDILSLGEKDQDLDDLDKLMDIIEAEIADGVSEDVKETSNLKMNNDYVVKNATELNANIDPNRNVLTALNQPKIIEVSKSQLNSPKEKLESEITFETNTNSSSQCTVLKSCVVLKSPTPFNTKRSISPYTKYLNKCSTTVDHSRLQHRSLSPRRLSPIREKVLSPIQCSPPESLNTSTSTKKTFSFLSKVILPNDRKHPPFSRKNSLKRKSRSPDKSSANNKSNSPIKKLMKPRQIISPTIQCANNNDYLPKTVQLKPVDKEVKIRTFDPLLEQVLDVKKLSIQYTDSVDLRTELKRRRALRLNKNKLDAKKKSESFYPTRLLQSAIRDVVDSSTNGVKRKNYPNKPEIRVQTEGNSNGRRVILLSGNQHNHNDEVENYSSAKRLKANYKKVPLHLRVTGVSNNNMKQIGLKKIIRQNINVTDIDQVFDVLITCNFFLHLLNYNHLTLFYFISGFKMYCILGF